MSTGSSPLIGPSVSSVVPDWIRPLSDIEREAIETAIALCDGSVQRAAAALGVAPSTLYRKRQAWVKPD